MLSFPLKVGKDSMFSRLFQPIINKDKALHAYITTKFPRTVRVVDAILSIFLGIVSSPLFSIILALVLVPLVTSETMSLVNAVSISGAWVVAVAWLARSAPLKDFPVPSRFLIVALLAIILAVSGIKLGHWSTQKSEAHHKERSEAAVKNEEPKNSPNAHDNVPPTIEPPSKANTSKATPTHPVAPLVRQRSVPTLIPFNDDGEHARILSDGNLHDPLFKTYSKLAELGEIPRQDPLDKSPIADAEVRAFIGNVLSYYLLRSIFEMQNDVSYSSYSTETRVLKVDSPSPISVPDAEIYPLQRLESLLAQTVVMRNSFSNHIEYHYFWNHIPKLEMPSGTEVQLLPDSLVLSKGGYFTLRFDILKQPGGKGVLPQNFVPFQKVHTENVSCYGFLIKMRFQWDRDYGSSQPYVDWATALFDGIEKRFKQPS